jgi:hypothetical protein
MDDLIKQLYEMGMTNSIALQAADWIIRLRAERDELQREVDRLYDEKFSSNTGLWNTHE